MARRVSLTVIMKKLINDPDDVVDEMLDGMTAAYPDRLRRLPDTQVSFGTFGTTHR